MSKLVLVNSSPENIQRCHCAWPGTVRSRVLGPVERPACSICETLNFFHTLRGRMYPHHPFNENQSLNHWIWTQSSYQPGLRRVYRWCPSSNIGCSATVFPILQCLADPQRRFGRRHAETVAFQGRWSGTVAMLLTMYGARARSLGTH